MNLRRLWKSTSGLRRLPLGAPLAEVTLIVPREQLDSRQKLLREKRGLAFEQCIDVCGVDYARLR